MIKDKLDDFIEIIEGFEIAEIKGDKEQMKFYSNKLKEFQVEMGLADEEIKEMISEFHNLMYIKEVDYT